MGAGSSGIASCQVLQERERVEDNLAPLDARHVHQVLNQPGMANATNQALAPKAATLSRSDLITFKKAG